MSILHGLNLALAFLLELALLGIFGYWGFASGAGAITRFALGIGLPLLVAAVWSIWLAPKSSRRLKPLPMLLVKLALFGLAAALLIEKGHLAFGVAFAVLSAINIVLLRFYPVP